MSDVPMRNFVVGQIKGMDKKDVLEVRKVIIARLKYFRTRESVDSDTCAAEKCETCDGTNKEDLVCIYVHCFDCERVLRDDAGGRCRGCEYYDNRAMPFHPSVVVR